MYHCHEVVRVINECFLIDPESYQCNYRTRDERPLDPGYYIVLWPETVLSPRYDSNAQYVGPFGSKQQAEVMATRFADACACDEALGQENVLPVETENPLL